MTNGDELNWWEQRAAAPDVSPAEQSGDPAEAAQPAAVVAEAPAPSSFGPASSGPAASGRPVPPPGRPPPPLPPGFLPDDNRSLIKQAAKGNVRAVGAMVRFFIPDDERVLDAAFLGSFGIFTTERAFLAITDKRVAAVSTGPFRSFKYQDALHEHINSSALGQPPRRSLYVRLVFVWLVAVAAGVAFAGWRVSERDNGNYMSNADIAATAILLPLIGAVLLSLFISQLWYKKHKAAIYLHVREGLSIVSFVDNKSLAVAAQLFRRSSIARDDRLAVLSLSAA